MGGGTVNSYAYNQNDQLISFSQGSTTASYAYDGTGLRTSKTVGSTTEGFVWDVAEGMPTILQDGSTRYITGPGGLPIEQVDGSGNTQYYVQDQLGSTRGLLDSSGNIVGTYTFDTYGALKGHGGTASTPFGYAGQYTDSESGLQYLRARYYDPSTQQFLTVDPLVGMTADPYTYTAGNPLNLGDSSGLCKAGPISIPLGDSHSCSADFGAGLVQATRYVATRGRVAHAVVHAGLDLIALVPYADYYLAYRTLSTISLGTFTCDVVVYQNWGLSADIGLDRFKESTLANGEQPNDEDKYIYVLPVHWGPKVWGPGGGDNQHGKIDLWPSASYPWQSGFGRPKP